MRWFDEISLLDGWLPTTVGWLAALAGAVLLGTRSRRYIVVVLPVCVAVAALASLGVYLFVEDMWQPFPDALPVSVYVWFGIASLAILLVVPRIVVSTQIWGRLGAVFSAAVVVVAAVGAVNMSFAYLPTVGTAIALGQPDSARLSAVPAHTSSEPVAKWTGQHDVPATGRIVTASVPGPISHFRARSPVIYLPPAYFTNPRPLLPVLVLLAGQPGEPNDWLRGGKLVTTMDRYAAQHTGLAPVVVVADGTGSTLGNPLCVDSRLGNVSTYLAIDVPDWIRRNLQVDPDPHAWAIGGLSYGGTCAFQLATNHPAIYPTFFDISGQLEPTLGNRRHTLDAAFGGSQARFDAVNPLSLLSRHRYPDSAGIFLAGASDGSSRHDLTILRAKAEAAGMNVRYAEIPGNHDFRVWSAGLRHFLPAISNRLGLNR